jgi:hypothetical protein
MTAPFPLPATDGRSSVMDAALDLILAGEMFEEARHEADRVADELRARWARQQDAYWARRDAELLP